MEMVVTMVKEPLLYLPFHELCVVAHDTCKYNVTDSDDAAVDYDEDSIGCERQVVDNPVNVECDFHKHVQDEESVSVTHGGTSVSRQSGQAQPEDPVLRCRH
jgi:hypothetical protein